MLIELLSTIAVPPSSAYEIVYSNEIQTIHNHGLASEEGRMEFLQAKLNPFMIQVEALNSEIQALSKRISETDENNQEEILDLCNQLTAKMEMMSPLLSVMEKIIVIDVDFATLDQILSKTSPLQTSEEEVIKRVASLCNDLDGISL